MSIVFVLFYFDALTIHRYVFYGVFLGIFMMIVWVALIFYRYRSYFVWSGWRFNTKDFMHIFRYSIWILLAANVGVILSQIDMQMIVYML